jgi:nicotinate-nucleotide adenylyltransferase
MTDSPGRTEVACSRVEAYVRAELSSSRLEHVLGVAEYAVFLAGRFGEDQSRARLAALAHDLAREWPPDVMEQTALTDGLPVSTLEREVPKVLHGRAAAVYLREHFHVRDEEVLSAIRNHTLGNTGMSRLEKILFCADYLEPGRKYIEPAFRDRVEQLDLDEMVCACVEHNTRRGHDPADRTLAMYRELCGGEYPA